MHTVKKLNELANRFGYSIYKDGRIYLIRRQCEENMLISTHPNLTATHEKLVKLINIKKILNIRDWLVKTGIATQHDDHVEVPTKTGYVKIYPSGRCERSELYTTINTISKTSRTVKITTNPDVIKLWLDLP